MSTDPVDNNSIFQEGEVTPKMPEQAAPDQGTKTPAQTNVDEVFSEQLLSIKNEDGSQKYSNIATALAALKHTQDHVKTLENENENFRQESVKAKTMDEVLQQLNTTKQDQGVQTSSPEMDVETMRKVSLEVNREIQEKQKAEANQTRVVMALVDKFKDAAKAEEAFNAKATELGLSVDLLNDLAATSPKAVLEYFEIKKEGTTNPIEGTVNIEALNNNSEPTKPKKNIMYGATTQDIVAAWRDAAPDIEQ